MILSKSYKNIYNYTKKYNYKYKTIKRNGGKVLGKGAKGKIITSKCGNKNTACSIIFSKSIEKDKPLIIYTIDSQKYKLQKNSVYNIFDKIKQNDQIVIKEFKNKNDFKNEMESFYKVYKNMGMDFIKNKTSLGLIEYNNKNIIAFELDDLYYLINKKCDITVQSIAKTITSDDLSKMIKEILITLKEYQEKGLHHNDLKADNIMLCDNNFTLIDLDYMMDNEELYSIYKNKTSTKHRKPYGSEFITSPLAIYAFTGKPDSILNKLPIAYTRALIQSIPFTFNTMKKYVNFYNEYILKNNKEFIEKNKNKDRLEIYKEFKDHFDVYSLGVSIAQIYFIQNENLPKHFLEFSKYLTNPLNKNFPKNASEALALYEPLPK